MHARLLTQKQEAKFLVSENFSHHYAKHKKEQNVRLLDGPQSTTADHGPSRLKMIIENGDGAGVRRNK